ncbi:MAG TPA: hypothetical protein VK173_09130 [Lacibacter sp.]|nr:hypothetical protein [Lacibacter sp.]
MKLLKIAPLFLLLITLITSCTKEKSTELNGNTPGPGSTSDIRGDWKLVSISGVSTVRDTFIALGSQAVIISKYTYASTSASGSYTITNTDFISKGISYDFDGKLVYMAYEDGLLILNDSMDASSTIPPTNGTAPYKLQGADSLYFTSGGILSIQGSNTTNVTPGGCKYKLEGNKLTLTMKMQMSENIVQNGITGRRKLMADAIVVLQK